MTTRCMMRFVRTRVLQSKVRSLLRTKAICALTSIPRALRALVGGFLLVGCRSLLCVESLWLGVRDLCDPRLLAYFGLFFSVSQATSSP